MNRSPILGLVLAGGLSRRFPGPEKCFALLADRPILDRITARAAQQVDQLLINANGDPRRFSLGAYQVIPDIMPKFPGPLAGLHAGLDWASRRIPDSRHIISFAGDSPFFPLDLAQRLCNAEEGDRPVIATCEGRQHPMFGLWPVALRNKLGARLSAGQGRVLDFAADCGAVEIPFPEAVPDPFFNINTPADLVTAERLLAVG